MSVEIELIYVEKPSKTTIEIDGKKYEGATSRKDAKVGKFLCINNFVSLKVYTLGTVFDEILTSIYLEIAFILGLQTL